MKVEDVPTAIEWALSFLGCMRFTVHKPCVVLDIDGTVLLNRKDGSSACVRHFTSFCDACHANDIGIFCITARPDDPYNRRYTMRQLEKCAVGPLQHLYMRPERADYGTYKHKARADVEKKGYSILLTVGDQFADIMRTDPPPELSDDAVYVGQIADSNKFGIKLPSEFL
jgi:predicted secreted acid phosphatase